MFMLQSMRRIRTVECQRGASGNKLTWVRLKKSCPCNTSCGNASETGFVRKRRRRSFEGAGCEISYQSELSLHQFAKQSHQH